MANKDAFTLRLKGRVALVTGSTGGMGEGIARRLAAEGAAVIISGRRTGQGEAVAKSIAEAIITEYGGDIDTARELSAFIKADVSIEADCVHLIHAAVEHFGRLDILVNNAAITPQESPGEQSAALWDEVFAVNVRGAFMCSREAIPIMRKQGGGRIINIGSTVPQRGDLNRLAYGSAKGALLTMTKMMARGLVRDRILVNWIAVGWVATPGEVALRNQVHGDGPGYLAEVGRNAPLGRLESIDDIAAGVVYLASDEASHVTGCELNISGGLLI
jgi:NAD(P)-dependent dehydrogenase (short-subunit alcohol dehydrogenase family)